MTAHRRPWRLRAGLVVALFAGAIGGAVPTTAAFADAAPVVALVSVDSSTLGPGDAATIKFKVTNPASVLTSISATASATIAGYVSLKHDGTACGGSTCNWSDTTDTSTYTLTVTAKADGPASPLSGKISITASSAAGNGNSVDQSLTLQAAQNTSTVVEVSGVVKDSATGQGIGGVKIELQDNATPTKTFTTTSNNAGAYSFKSTAQKPITAGVLAIAASKDGYSFDPKPLTVAAGGSAKFDIVMLSTATPSTAASGPVTDSQAASDSGSSGIAGTDTGQGKGNHYLLFMIIAGAVLIIAGIGAIVTLVLRRRNEDDEEEDDDGPPRPRRGPPPGRSAGSGYRPDATVVARESGFDDRTAIVRPVVDDEYPDPYGAPPPQRVPAPGYGGRNGGQRPGYGGGQYGGAASGGYDQPTTYSPPPPRAVPDDLPGSGYGGGAEYGRGPSRYDEPTSAYTPGQYGGGTRGAADPYQADPYQTQPYQADPYPADPYPGNGYRGEPYPDEPRSGGAPASGQAYGAPRSTPPAPPRGGYPPAGQQQYGGYDQTYDRGGYDGARPGYEPARPAEPEYGAADPGYASRGGYGSPAGYGSEPGYGSEEYGAAQRRGAPEPRSNGGGRGQQYGGYDQAYDQRGHDTPRPGPEPGGYDNTSRHSAAPARGPEPRRSLDWLDD